MGPVKKAMSQNENKDAIKSQQTDVESNINNIKELIQQIKLTEFEKNTGTSGAALMKPDILKSTTTTTMPDYDNIQDDYEMTDGKLERIPSHATKVVTVTVEMKPNFISAIEENGAIMKELSENENDEVSIESKSITNTSSTTASSSLRETSVESSSERVNNINVKNINVADDKHESAAIYRDAIEFLHETVDAKAITEAAVNEINDHKSPIKSIRQDKEVVLNYIDKINENLDAVKTTITSNTSELCMSEESDANDDEPKMSVKESVLKLERKISLSRQNSEVASETASSDISQYNTPSKEPSTPVQIKPIVLPKVLPSDTESLYNSSEELSMIFGHSSSNAAANEQQQNNVPIHPGKIDEEDENDLVDDVEQEQEQFVDDDEIVEEDFEAEFEKIAHVDEILDDKLLDENFNVTLIDLNNNTDYAECFDNELSDLTNKCAISSVASKSEIISSTASCFQTTSNATSVKCDDNNNNFLTSQLSKLTTNQLMNRKPKNTQPSTSNNNSLKTSSGTTKSNDNNSSTAQQPLKTQCILLACIYCIMLYLQFIIFNFKSSN
jgi:hypothetical protein